MSLKSVTSPGQQGPPGPSTIGAPIARTLSFATAYQALDPTNPTVIMMNMNSAAALTLSGGTTNTATVYMGPTTAVATGTGIAVGQYSNSLTGTLVIGVAINTVALTPLTFLLPVGYYFAILISAGNVTLTSVFDQAVG